MSEPTVSIPIDFFADTAAKLSIIEKPEGGFVARYEYDRPNPIDGSVTMDIHVATRAEAESILATWRRGEP